MKKKIKKEKMMQPIMKKIKLKLARNIIKKHIQSNNNKIIHHNKINSITNLDSNTNKNIININKNNKTNNFKLINNNIKNNEIKTNIFKKINSPKAVKSPFSTVGMNYIFSAKKPTKKSIINHFNLSNLCNLNFNNSKNINNITLNLNNNNSKSNNHTNNNLVSSPNNIIHYHKINKTKTLDKLKNPKRPSKQKQRNKLEKIIQNLYTNITIKSPLNSPKNKRVNIPLNNLSQVISPEMCNKIIKANTQFKNSSQRPNKLVKNYQKSDIKPNKKIRKINLSSIRNIEIGNYLTKKNSRNKILQLSKFNNMNNNNAVLKIQKNKKVSNDDKKLEFKVSIPSFPNGSLYNQFLTNQTINITLSNCFNNSTINEKKDKIEAVKPFHRRYASNNFPNSSTIINNNINNNTNNNSKINDSNLINNNHNTAKSKNKIYHCVNNY